MPNPGERPTAALINYHGVRKHYRMTERDLRRAMGYGLLRAQTMFVREDVEAFLAKWGKTRPPRPGHELAGAAK
jgi:hypothetical protein